MCLMLICGQLYLITFTNAPFEKEILSRTIKLKTNTKQCDVRSGAFIPPSFCVQKRTEKVKILKKYGESNSEWALQCENLTA